MANICPSCGNPLTEGASFCENCGAKIEGAQPMTVPDLPVLPMQTAPIYAPAPAKPFTWGEAFAVLGFVLSLVGIFWCSVVLMPVGIVLSILGFMKSRLKGLSTAALTISVLGLLIRICVILYETGILPQWLTSGLF